MEAKKLRIGNYVNLIADGHEHEPDTFQWTIEDYEYYETEMFNILPIPLTEEWKDKIEYNEYIRIDMIGFIIYSNGHQYHFSVNDYPYVHQIQNLYFALTNEELIIK
tara:strand:+ start:538 stop:858 length:321 start_codon:yes stop_codon:yes gene_type:complete